MSISATRELGMRFPGGLALDQLTIDIEPGVVGLVGANGAGKSTLIKMLLGLLEHSSVQASVLVCYSVLVSMKIRELVGYMPEHDCLPPDVSATEFIVHAARVSG